MKKQMSYSFFLRESFNAEELAHAFALLLGVDSTSVLVVNDINGPEKTADVFIEREILAGDFHTYLSIYIGIPVVPKSEIDFAREVSRELGCDALCGGDSLNPYHWVLLQNDLPISDVLLRDEPLDERGEAVVCWLM